ncbi:MAG: ribonuclease HII [Firmicutes bacterium]|nr:ribonuclease HII [Bacillota bacterium]
MITIENEIRDEGYEYIACIDEVGRGCLAGDVVACAVIMPKDLLIEGVNDSKKLTPKKRDKLYDIIIEEAIAVGVGSVDNKTIDEINIKKSTFLAMKKAIENLKDKEGNTVKPDFLLIDAEKLDVKLPQKSVIKGDEKCHGIAAASIIAKVYRDRQCIKWAEDYDGYGFERNKGYGTKEHREALLEKGPSPIHRMTFLTKILSKNKQISFLK